MSTRNGSKPLNLALQGGGAHGAFTWGVLDALLEDGRIAIDSVSGTSAGAMNGAAMITGLTVGGPEAARERMERFWRLMSRVARLAPGQATPMERLLYGSDLDRSPAFLMWDTATRFFSPYDLNPFDINPLRGIVERVVDIEALRSCRKHKLFVSATNVHTGKVRVFSQKEITIAAIMASACLPFLYQAVEIDGVPYWDGGFMGNPALFPFFRTSDTEDVLLIQINPIERLETPRTAREILNRMNEITFNASLISELRAIKFVSRMVEEGKLKHGGKNGYKQIRMHRIGGDAALAGLSASSKFNADWMFLQELRDMGRAAAASWLETHFEDIGVRATLDIHRQLANPQARPETD